MLYSAFLKASCYNHTLLHYEGSSTVKCLISRPYTFICRDCNHRTRSRMTTKNLTSLRKLFNIGCVHVRLHYSSSLYKAEAHTDRAIQLKNCPIHEKYWADWSHIYVKLRDVPLNVCVSDRRSQCIVSFVPLLEKMIKSCFFPPKDASSKALKKIL